MAEIILSENNTTHALSQKSAGRVVAGLAWDPNPNPGLKGSTQRLFGKYADTDFDLDLNCYIYDGDGNCIDIVAGEKSRLIDASGGIRHGGDERDGETQGDDERIIIDLLTLPREITSLVLLCEVASAHSFGDIYNPQTRVADYGTDENLLHAMLGKDNSSNKSACVFASLQRDADDYWQARHILHYLDREEQEGTWPAYLAQFTG